MLADAIRLNDGNVSNPTIEAKIKSWLRLATDRDGGRRRRFLAAEKRQVLLSVATDAWDACYQSSDTGNDQEASQQLYPAVL